MNYLDELSGKAGELLKEHGKLSVPFLMRKFKIDCDKAQQIMIKLGQDIWITAEEYRKGQNSTSKVGEWLSG